MKLTNETEEDYKLVEKRLEDIGARIPTGVKIMQNIVGICNAIADGKGSNEITNEFNLTCANASFSATFKKTTGVSVTDIPSMTAFDKKRRKLIEAGYTEEKVKEILEIVKG